MLMRKVSKPPTSRLIARLVPSSIEEVLDEEVVLGGGDTPDTLAMRQ
jgi:hypothetical protein